MSRLEDKVAIVTGASRGIGYAIAAALVEAGASVMITGRREDSLRAAAAGLGERAATWCGDAASAEVAEACIGETLRRFGSIDILVNNAALNPQKGPTIAMALDDFDAAYALNVRAPLVWTQLAWNRWMRESGGAVLNISSLGGVTLYPNMGAYNSSKAALNHLTRVLAAELGPRVRVNALVPGIIKTEASSPAWRDREERIAGKLPMERLGECEDVAKAALFLVSDDASWITGASLTIDGGALIQWGRGKPRDLSSG